MATQKVFLGHALVTDHGDWAEGKTAQTNDIYHTADGAFMSTVDNNTATPGAGVDGWRVWFDAKKINDAETARQKAEAKRVDTFNTNENNRQSSFEENEATRQQTFNDKEAERDAAIEEVSTYNDRLSSLETSSSSHDHDIEAVVSSRIGSPDYNSLPLLCGQPPILFGADTPQEAVVPVNWHQFDPETGEGYNWNGLPSAIGQQYINTSVDTGGRYIAVPGANGALSWKNM